MITLAADVGGTRIKLALIRDHSVLGQSNIEARSHEGLAPQLPRIVVAFEKLCFESDIGLTECSALAMVFPGLVDIETGRVQTTYGKYDDATELNLVEWSKKTLRLPLVIENDARAALIGEWKAGAGSGCDNLVMLTLGTGLGTAALINGQLIRGRHGQAGVLGGHSTVSHGGRLCACGNRGCAEAEASTFVLPLLAREHPDFPFSSLRNLNNIDYESVFRLAHDNDGCAESLRQQAIDIWSATIVNLIHAYDPERVIIGGGIAAGADKFLPDLEREVRAHAHTPWGHVGIFPAQLGDAAALLGGETLARERIPGAQ